jgi:hypothetical protein
MDKSPIGAVRPGSTWRFVARYLWAAFATALCITLGLVVYNSLRFDDLQKAEAALHAQDSQSLMQAYELLQVPHIFGGWHPAERIIPNEPVFEGITEEQLFEATLAAPNPDGIVAGSRDIGTCGLDADCVWQAMVLGETTMQRVQLWFYLRLRFALQTGSMIEPAAQKLFAYHPSLFVAAVSKQIGAGQCVLGEGTETPVRSLYDNLRVSIDNTWIFAGFCGVVTLIFLFTLVAWRFTSWRVLRDVSSA